MMNYVFQETMMYREIRNIIRRMRNVFENIIGRTIHDLPLKTVGGFHHNRRIAVSRTRDNTHRAVSGTRRTSRRIKGAKVYRIRNWTSSGEWMVPICFHGQHGSASKINNVGFIMRCWRSWKTTYEEDDDKCKMEVRRGSTMHIALQNWQRGRLAISHASWGSLSNLHQY
jgi:hypothetical protein